MRKFISILLVLVLFTTSLFASNPTSSPKLLVAAAASLTDVMEVLANAYEQDNPGTQVTVTYGSSGSLQKQIEQGAPIDVFMSASPKQVNALESENLLYPNSRTDLVVNELVLVTPKGENRIKTFSDLGSNKLSSLAIGEPTSVPAGKYASQTLDYLGLSKKVQKKLIYTKDVRQVLAYVSSNAVDAGLVYATDAMSTDDVQVVAIAPRSSHDIILYPAAVIKDSKVVAEAKTFIAWMGETKAQGIFAQFGFSKP